MLEVEKHGSQRWGKLKERGWSTRSDIAEQFCEMATEENLHYLAIRNLITLVRAVSTSSWQDIQVHWVNRQICDKVEMSMHHFKKFAFKWKEKSLFPPLKYRDKHGKN